MVARAKKSGHFPLDRLIPNEQWQTRHKLDDENVERLVQAYQDRPDLVPPILVRRIGESDKYEIFDGFHRFAAAKQLGLETIDAEVFKGSEHEALTAGVQRNLTHGLQLIKDDMKRAAKMLYVPGLKAHVKKGEQVIGSSGWIGTIFGVSDFTVRNWVSPSANEKHKQRNKRRGAKAKKYDELGEEGLKEAILEKLGADAFSKTYQPTVKWSLDDARPGAPGTPVLMISDVHYGEAVDPEQVFGMNKFNRRICKERLEHTFKTAAELLKVHMARPEYPGIVVVLGGDMISGELHEDHQATDEAAPLQQAFEISEIVADGIAFMKEEFKNVDVYCVPGNHGRTTRKPRSKFYAHYNLDWAAYKMIEKHFRGDDRVVVNAPNARDMTFTVAGRRYRLTHGDQFRGGDGIIGCIGPIIRGDVKKRVTASLMPAQPEQYDTMICGHFHTLMMLPRVIVNGSVKGYDEYAHSINVPWEPPQQALWTVHPKHGQTWYCPVICDPAYSAHGILKELK